MASRGKAMMSEIMVTVNWAPCTPPVIASEAKQSRVLRRETLDCFVATAPRNDGWIGRLLTSPHSQSDIPAGAIPRPRSPPR
ncbi:hypothetical protein XH86_17385 [Bradyrhizobium guangdongense]|uniref:Uncharacterized protein n=1 Tax=Bradyrhizobium guangdongense TaxID=1325090 RepID=A0ABX6UG49_9BRAD|nr:hypothetical protein X265_17380 [Bradyrhizobium guangdongense]QOZ60296.1 hypothetical protein XH86_17385 [Bradyrhizobium guangdongense]